MMEELKKRIETIRKISIYTLVAIFIFQSSFLSDYIIVADAKENNEMLTYTISFEHPILKQIKLDDKTFTTIEMSNCLSHATPGDPALPVRPIKILLPQGKKLSDIEVSYPKSVKIESELTKNPVLPQQIPIHTGSNTSNQTFLINTSTYESIEPVFETVYTVGDIGFCRGFAILTIHLYPIQYIPKTNTAYYFPEMNIKITLTEDIQMYEKEQNMYLRLDNQDIRIIESTVINPQTIDTYTPPNPLFGMLGGENSICNPEETYDYVIITNDALNSTVGQQYNWSDLLNHRITYSGFTATKITVETIDACSAYWNDTAIFNDSAAHIREFIKDAYQNWETQYVVLGGDDNVVPARIFVEYNSLLNGDDYDDMPCDMYYSHLTGDWRDTTHNCWGGGRNSGANDHYAEVYVGRMTVDSANQLSNFIKKILWYDISADNEFVNNTAFFGGNLGALFSVTSAEYMDEIRNGNDPHFYQCTGFSEWNANHPDEVFDISTRIYYNWGDNIPSDYQTAINTDSVCLINHLGHGTPTSALDMTNAQLAAISNSKYFFSYSQQCLSGRFTVGDTTEKTITSIDANNGAFGLVWNTGYGWASSSDTNGPNQFLQRHFWHYIFNSANNSWQIGKSQAYAKDEMSVYIDIPGWHYAWCYNWYSSHLFGDPAQTLKATVPDPEPYTINDETPIDGAINVSVGNVTLSITVSDLEGDLMNITFRTNASEDWQDIGTNSSQYNGTYTKIYNFSNYSTKYWWSVNVTDLTGYNRWKNETYQFTTRPPIHVVSPPDNFDASAHNKTQINLTWLKGVNATHTYIERHAIHTWNRGEGGEIYNGTDTAYNDKNCIFGTIYYYQAWSWDNVDSIWSVTNASDNTYTINIIPEVYNETPENASANQIINPLLSITISDLDNDPMNITFWTNATGTWNIIGYNYSSSNGAYQQNTSCFNNYLTLYWWSANCTDGQVWDNKTYRFTTKANQEPVVSDESPLNAYTVVSQSISALTITIIDPEEGSLNWTIETSPNIGNISWHNDISGTKTCSVSGLQYLTTYYWYVNITDNGSRIWVNKTYWFTTGDEQDYENLGSEPNQNQNPAINNPPTAPNTPNGTTTGYVNTTYEYSTNTTDQDNDQIQFRFDWGDGTISDWTELVESNTTIIQSHNWRSNETYEIKAQAKDEEGEESDWSEALTVILQQLPSVDEEIEIIIDALENTTIYQTVDFNCLIFNNSDNENITYSWDFGDGATGDGKSPSHHYLTSGTYVITVTIYNSDGEVLDITSFEIYVSPEGELESLKENGNSASQKTEIASLSLFGIISGITIVFLVWSLKKKKK